MVKTYRIGNKIEMTISRSHLNDMIDQIVGDYREPND